MEKGAESEICTSFLQWGSRKRPRGVHGRKSEANYAVLSKPAVRVHRRVVRAENEALVAAADDRKGSPAKSGNVVACKKSIRSSSPERNDRAHEHRQHAQNGAPGVSQKSAPADEEAKNKMTSMNREDRPEALVWPKFMLTLSRQEKEQDFLAMKGTKLPLRPKKRAKQIQRAINAVTPGGWLSELSKDRYEVKEKKSSKKRPRGLKAMRSIDIDSE